MIRKTKIIATVGPSTSSKEMLIRIIQRGVNVCRLNFSHLSHKKAKEIISLIKEINQELHVHTAILADLQGPKIRVGEFVKPLKLKKGSSCLLHSSIVGMGLIKNFPIKNIPKKIFDLVFQEIGKNGTLSALTPYYDYGLKFKKFDLLKSNSAKDVGSLSDLISKKKESTRSLNPLFNISSIELNSSMGACSILSKRLNLSNCFRYSTFLGFSLIPSNLAKSPRSVISVDFSGSLPCFS